MKEKEWVQPVPTLDLRRFCRDINTVKTIISLLWDSEHEFPWIHLGQIRLLKRGNDHNYYRGVWTLDSFVQGHTDEEHDSAHILSMQLIGVDFGMILYGQTEIHAYVDPNLSPYCQFSVPEPDYDPLKDATPCDHCRGEEAHLFVNYLPPDNRELYQQVRGKRIIIRTGKVFDEE